MIRWFIKTLVYAVFKPFIIRRGKSDKVFLTFDDGPHPENTVKLLDILAKHQVKASFFMVGKDMESYPEVVDLVKQAGHHIGYHSYSHRRMSEMSWRELSDDLNKVKQLNLKFGLHMKTYRPPFGDLGFRGLLLSMSKGLKIVMWTVDSRDSFDSREMVLQNVSPTKLVGGDIILLHDDYADVSVVDDILTRLAQEQVAVAELQ